MEKPELVEIKCEGENCGKTIRCLEKSMAFKTKLCDACYNSKRIKQEQVDNVHSILHPKPTEKKEMDKLICNAGGCQRRATVSTMYGITHQYLCEEHSKQRFEEYLKLIQNYDGKLDPTILFTARNLVNITGMVSTKEKI